MSTPNPGTTPWVPMWNLNGGMDLRYNGAWQAGNYYDGDVVVYNGITYLCVRPTSQPPKVWGAIGAASPSVRVYRSTAQSVASGAWVPISFDTVRYDRGPSAHWSAANPTRLTCQVAGTYAIVGQVTYNNGGGGVLRIASIVLNGSTHIQQGGMSSATITATDLPRSPISALIQLNVGDYIEVNARQDSGSTITTYSDSTFWGACELSMALVNGMPGPPGPATPVNYGTQLPSNPTDGQEAILVDSISNPSYTWRFRYNASSTSAYKWEFIGGADYLIGASASYTTPASDTTWKDGNGPSFTLPRAGIYEYAWGTAYCYCSLNNTGSALMGVTPPGSSSPPVVFYYNGSIPVPCGNRWTLPSAAGVVKAQYQSNTASITASFVQAWMTVLPVRVA